MSELKVEISKGKTFSFDQLTSTSALMNGEAIDFDLLQLKEGKFHLLKNDRSFKVEVVDANAADKTFVIKVNKRVYEAKVEDRFDLLLHQLGMDQMASAGISDLKAPMPGLVLKTLVAVGQEVKKDDPLVILEAMKMENVLKAPADLVVKSIAMEEGQAVEKNQLLIEFES